MAEGHQISRIETGTSQKALSLVYLCRYDEGIMNMRKSRDQNGFNVIDNDDQVSLDKNCTVQSIKRLNITVYCKKNPHTVRLCFPLSPKCNVNVTLALRVFDNSSAVQGS